MIKILVTGATGSLGRAVIALINQSEGYQVVSVGRQAFGLGNYISCDICNNVELIDTLERVKPDVILHLAATFSGDFNEAYATNVLPTKHILEFVQHKLLKTRVVIIGSAAEYGVVNISENPIRENRLLAPVSVYGLSKAWQSQLISLYRGCGLDVLGARVFNLYGSGISDRLFAGRLQNQISDILDGKKDLIEVGRLTAVRDYISTEDAAIQVLSIMQNGLPGEIYHVASGVPVTMREIMQRELLAAGLSFSIVKESAKFSNRSGYDVPMIYADISKTLFIMPNKISLTSNN